MILEREGEGGRREEGGEGGEEGGGEGGEREGGREGGGEGPKILPTSSSSHYLHVIR